VSLSGIVLGIIVAMAPPDPYARETGEMRQTRFSTIAEAIVIEVMEDTGPLPPHVMISALLVTAREESGFRLVVHSGRARGDLGSSICLTQIRSGAHKFISRSRWRGLAGTGLESTRECIRATIEILNHHAVSCEIRKWNTWSMAGLFTSYGTGHTCRPDYNSKRLGKFGLRRAYLWDRIMKTLVKSSGRCQSDSCSVGWL